MTPKAKQTEIVKAIKNGVPKVRINPENKGNLARRLLKGENLPAEEIDRMHENLLEYRRNPNKYRAINESYRNYMPEVSREDKIKQIVQAVESGTAKNWFDPAGVGDAVRKLQKGKFVGEGKINEMYAKLLALCGKQPNPPPGKKAKQISGKDRVSTICEQQKQLEALKIQVASLQKQVKELAQATKAKASKKKQIIKVLGVTVVEKTDKVRDKKYKRWYGTFREEGKQHWIYIGADITQARSKIRNYLEKRKGKQKCMN